MGLGFRKSHASACVLYKKHKCIEDLISYQIHAKLFSYLSNIKQMCRVPYQIKIKRSVWANSTMGTIWHSKHFFFDSSIRSHVWRDFLKKHVKHTSNEQLRNCNNNNNLTTITYIGKCRTVIPLPVQLWEG